MIYTRSYPHYSNNDPIHWSGCHITNPLSKASVSMRPRYHVRLLVCLCVWWSSSVNDDVIFRYVLRGRCYLCLSPALTNLDIIDVYPHLTVLPAVLLSGYIMHSCYIVVNLIHVVNVYVLSTQPQVATFVVNLPKKKECFLNCLAQLPPRAS